MINHKNVELLAPAGSFEALKAAIANGANAVYLGLKNFGARAFANNFSHEELKEALIYAHKYATKVYVTMNTLLNDYELSKALDEVSFLYKIGVDALIIQDLGLYYEVKHLYPDFPLHASTQMHIHNTAGVLAAKKMGFERVVIARETSLKDLNDICKLGIEIEAFVHGAICVSYSGQCLMSSSLMNRSGNKGVCSQCCRLPYKLIDTKKGEVIIKQKYLLSTHDNYQLNDIPSLLSIGVSSFKIEGRMKKPAYVGYVTAQYRKAIDAYFAKEKYNVNKDTLNNLKVLFNRGFTNSYLLNKGASFLYNQDSCNHQGIELGNVLYVRNKQAFIHLKHNLNQFDGIRFLNKNEDGLIVNRLYKNGLLVNGAKKGELISVDIDFPINNNCKVRLTSDYQLEKSIKTEGCYYKYPLKLYVQAKIDNKLKLVAYYQNKKFSVLSTDNLEKALTSTIEKNTLIKHLDHFVNTCFYLTDIEIDLAENVFIPVKLIKELRRKLLIMLEEYLITNQHRHLYLTNYNTNLVPYLNSNIVEYNYIHQKENGNNNCLYISETPSSGDYLLYPVINPSSSYPYSSKVVISEIGGLFLEAEHKIAYYTLNCSNLSAYTFLRSLGFEAIILSSELTTNDLKRMDNKIDFHIFTYGKRDLMNLKYSPLSPLKLKKNNDNYQIVYNNKIFPIIKRLNRTIILEDKPHISDYQGAYTFKRYSDENKVSF